MKVKEMKYSELRRWIRQLEAKGHTASPQYKGAVEERSLRLRLGLRVGVSLLGIIRNAQAGQYSTYGDLADANDLPFSKVRHSMNGQTGHLEDLGRWCKSRKLPPITALIVNTDNLDSGDLEPPALDGFIEGVKRLGYVVTDPAAFLKQCQAAAFEWVKTQAAFDLVLKLKKEVVER